MARSFKSTSRSGAAHVAFDHGNGVGHYIVVAPFVHDVATPVELRVGSGSNGNAPAKLGECWVAVGDGGYEAYTAICR